MTHVVSGLMRKPPFIKQGCGPNGDSTLYAIELSEVNKDYRTGDKTYTNYKAMFFAKTDAANGYYSKAFAEGSFVVVAAEKLAVNVSDCGQYIKLQMESPRLEGAHIPEGQAAPQQPQQQGGYQQPQQPQQPQQQGGYQQPQQPQQQAPAQQRQAPQQQQAPQNPPMDFDDDIPF